jgi:NADPH2:quinone reductase
VLQSAAETGSPMQAIRIHQFGEPEVLKVEEISTPPIGPGQVVLRTRAVGVNPVETYIRAGKYGPREFPFTPGNDCAGLVDRVGEGVNRFKPGDRVYTDRTLSGAYAQLVLCDAENVHPLPQRATFQQGAAIGAPGGAAYRALFQRGRGIAGETVLVHGATGAVGTAAVQLARASGMYVVATASSEAGRIYSIEHGAHHAVDHDVTSRLDEVRFLTAGKGFDLIVEMLANKNLAADLPALNKRGRVVIVGSRGKIEIDPRETMAREAEILGMTVFAATPTEHRQVYSALTAALESGIYIPVIGLELPLAEAAKAHQLVIEGDHFGKIVLIP